jgi:cobalt-zinc-cadmium efflux system outer membrane protein
MSASPFSNEFSHQMNRLSQIAVILGLAALPLSLRAEEQAVPVSIDQLVSRTLATNPEVKFYEAEIAAAKAGRKAAGKLPNPELSLDLGRKRISNGNAAAEGLAYSVSLAQPVEWPGRLGLRRAIANGDVALAELGLERFRSFLAGRVRLLGFSLALQQENSAAAAEVSDRFSAVRDILVQRDPAGVAPMLEARIIQAAAIGVQHRAGNAQVEMQKALLELNQLMGKRADTPLVVRRTEFNPPAQADLESLLATAAANNFELRIRRAEIEQQGIKVELAKNERYPTFTVGPQFSQERAGDRETVVGIGLSVPLPLWNSGKESVDIAEARQIQASATLNAALRDIQRQVTEATLILNTRRQRLEGWKPETLQALQEGATLADQHYRLGAVPVSSYLEMQDRYLEALEAINESKLSAMQAALDLEQLTGTAPVPQVKPSSAKQAEPPAKAETKTSTPRKSGR